MSKKRQRFIRFPMGDQEWFDALIDEAETHAGSKNSTDRAHVVFRAVEKARRGGNRRASRVLQIVATEGIRRYAVQRQRDRKAPVEIPETGEIVNLTEVYGARATDARGLQMSYWERMEWWVMPRQKFFDLLSTLRGQSTKLGLKIRALERVAPIVESHPEAGTALEACQIEGVDPRDYGMRNTG